MKYKTGPLSSLLPSCPLHDSAGIHYLGQLHENSLLRVALDQITEGQLQFARLDEHFDTVVIGQGEGRREYRLISGKTEMHECLQKQFPKDTEAVDEFMRLMKVLSACEGYVSADGSRGALARRLRCCLE